MEELIKEWLEKGVDRAEFEFSCGGDSMNDTSLLFFDKENKEINISNINKGTLDNDIYRSVEFYVNSDGHYQGESGTVIIEFNKENNEFNYSKSAVSEFSESFSDIIQLEVTPELHKFCEEYIFEISGEHNYLDIEYNIDFYCNSEKIIMLEKIQDIINKAIENHIPEDTSGGELEDYISMSGFTTIDKNKIQFNYEYRKTVYY